MIRITARQYCKENGTAVRNRSAVSAYRHVERCISCLSALRTLPERRDHNVYESTLSATLAALRNQIVGVASSQGQIPSSARRTASSAADGGGGAMRQGKQCDLGQLQRARGHSLPLRDSHFLAQGPADVAREPVPVFWLQTCPLKILQGVTKVAQKFRLELRCYNS